MMTDTFPLRRFTRLFAVSFRERCDCTDKLNGTSTVQLLLLLATSRKHPFEDRASQGDAVRDRALNAGRQVADIFPSQPDCRDDGRRNHNRAGEPILRPALLFLASNGSFHFAQCFYLQSVLCSGLAIGLGERRSQENFSPQISASTGLWNSNWPVLKRRGSVDIRWAAITSKPKPSEGV